MKTYISRFPEDLGPKYRRTEYGWEPVDAWKPSKLPDHMQEKAALRAAEAAEKEKLRVAAAAARKAAMITDEHALVAYAEDAIEENPGIVAKIRDGKISAVNVLVGAAMRLSGGNADAARIRELLLERLS